MLAAQPRRLRPTKREPRHRRTPAPRAKPPAGADGGARGRRVRRCPAGHGERASARTAGPGHSPGGRKGEPRAGLVLHRGPSVSRTPRTCRTVPGIQLREYRTEVNGAKAGLHGEVGGWLPQLPPLIAGLDASTLPRRRTWRRPTAAQKTQYSLNAFLSLSGRIPLWSPRGLAFFFLVPEQLYFVPERDTNCSIKTTFRPGKFTD